VEEEEAVSFCAASDKSRGRGRGRFEARRGEASPSPALLWLERRSDWSQDGSGVEWIHWRARARASFLGLKAQMQAESSGWRRRGLVRCSLGPAGTGGEQLEMHWLEGVVEVEEEEDEEHYSACRT
jgi:hypothetical protein